MDCFQDKWPANKIFISLHAILFDSFYFPPIHGYCYESNKIATSEFSKIDQV